MKRSRWFYLALEIGVTVAIIAAVWIYLDNNQSFAVVPIPDMLEAFRRTWLFDRFTSDVVPSIVRLLLGFGVAVLAGVSLGFVLGLSPLLRMATQPVISFLRSVPAAALVPIAIILLGVGTSMKVFLIAFVCTWPILLNTTDGVVELDSTILSTAKSYRVRGVELFRYVMLPAVSPRIFAGMRTSLSIAVLLLVVSEMLASDNGIGFFVFQAQQSFSVADMWAGILLLGLLGYVLNAVFERYERRALRWHTATHGPSS